MSYKPSEVEKCLKHKFNFCPSRHHEEGHKWFELQLPGLPIIATKLSHSKDEIRDRLLGKMARQCRVRPMYFKEMLNCNHSNADYCRKVTEDPYPPWNFRK
jgi:hypothetical protein